MTRRFGAEWARNYGTAHEMRPDNTQPREAMDLYNNEVGRQIALENPDASDEEIADLIERAVREGRTNGRRRRRPPHLEQHDPGGGPTGDGAAEGHVEGDPGDEVDPDADPDSQNEHGSGS